MARVINAQKLLELIKKPAGCDLVIKVTDEIIKENNRTFRVKGSKVLETKGTADIELSERALAQMAIGAINLDEAMLRDDVTVRAKEEMLRTLFPEKRIFVGEHF